MNKDTTENSIKQFYQLCHDRGLSVTPQRLAIYRSLIGSEDHPGPELVYQRIKDEFPMISLATVYKTLETFEQKGIISRVTQLHNTVRYDPLTKRHHHVICARCKKIIDLVSSELDAIAIPTRVTEDNILLDFSVHFNVICAECRELT